MKQLCDRVQNAIVYLLYFPETKDHAILMETLISMETPQDLLVYTVSLVEAEMKRVAIAWGVS